MIHNNVMHMAVLQTLVYIYVHVLMSSYSVTIYIHGWLHSHEMHVKLLYSLTSPGSPLCAGKNAITQEKPLESWNISVSRL